MIKFIQRLVCTGFLGGLGYLTMKRLINTYQIPNPRQKILLYVVPSFDYLSRIFLRKAILLFGWNVNNSLKYFQADEGEVTYD